jgi:hypothetical protein
VKTIGVSIGAATKLFWGALLAGALVSAPASAQVRSVDPDQAIDGDLTVSKTPPSGEPRASQAPGSDAGAPADQQQYDTAPANAPAAAVGAPATGSANAAASAAVNGQGKTYHEDDLIGAAQGVFGKGAKGLADLIKDILKKQGEPNGYIVGREGGGAFVVGLRYGSGTLYHKVEGERPVYWTGPSIGFDAGANAGNAFVLVYNLYDTEDLYKRFVAGEGQAYFVGGFNVSYLRAGDVVLVPVRLGVGLRLGANVGYMKFSHKQNWVPF